MYKLLYRTFACVTLFLISCQKNVPEPPEADPILNGIAERKIKPPVEKSVRFIYLIPSDKTFNKEYYQSITKAARSIQRWYREEMEKLTFRLNNPIVEVIYSEQTSGWFGTYNGFESGTDPFYYFYYNAYTETQALLGSSWNTSNYVFVVYVDAYGQTGAGATGTAFLPEHDLKGLAGDSDVPVSRWIGGLGHELGHGFGLPHPPEESMYWGSALMGLGYITFPTAELTPTDKETLLSSGFFVKK